MVSFLIIVSVASFCNTLIFADADISHALSKLTEPTPVHIHKLSVTNMVHTAKKKIRKHRGIDESPLNNEVLNAILLVSYYVAFNGDHLYLCI